MNDGGSADPGGTDTGGTNTGGMDPGGADRARGCLLAAACGDAVGAPFEGAPTVAEEEFDAAERAGAAALRYTDDTALLIALAEHLTATVCRGEDLDEDRLATTFAETWHAEPWRGYGAGAHRVFAEVIRGRSWREAAGGLFGGTGSHGNGGAMRVAPVGLLAGPHGRPAEPGPLAGLPHRSELRPLADLARRTASITHGHPLGKDGAAAQACSVALAYRSTGRLDAGALIDAVSDQVTEEAFRIQLGRVAALAGDRATPTDVAAEIGHDISALAAVPAALAAFLRHPDDPARAIRFAVLMGGDTDTIAAMTGALVGARCGEAALPPTWLSRLEAADRLRAAATRLAAAPPSR